MPFAIGKVYIRDKRAAAEEALTTEGVTVNKANELDTTGARECGI